MRGTQYVGAAALVSLFAVQLLNPLHSTAGSLAIFAVLLACHGSDEFARNAFVLGNETTLAIVGLFTVAGVVEHSPLFSAHVERLLANDGKSIELVAFAVTSLISADGAASLLTAIVHERHNGNLDSAWALASGICAGSTALLTSASAGPILIHATKQAGTTLSFRDYAAFGLPFSVLMLLCYVL